MIIASTDADRARARETAIRWLPDEWSPNVILWLPRQFDPENFVPAARFTGVGVRRDVNSTPGTRNISTAGVRSV
ncbi:hypothetical protein IU433_01545 [Nocardia puris]|uniref:hypothetical protein n=1 Tax=Nocardia puris TaxID=208602 RepID=UPI0018963020|nr:hypothetical protein [Nocardia puris]MBF6210470.1 hypothetical protein [Nocardia puris]MBF6367545.1 hypothetical protein [Nocardia puris]MBF6457730.1 hypothetical protein [Nocardia puris]